MLFHITATHDNLNCGGVKARKSGIDITTPEYVADQSRWMEGDDKVKVVAAYTNQPSHRIFVVVEADNHANQLSFSADSEDINDAFECVCVQHEIDHLDGITMFDREFKQEPLVRGKNAPLKIGRNVKIEITNGTDTKLIKWKKAEPMLTEGWTVVEESIPENVR